MYGLTVNYSTLAALVEALLEKDTLTGAEVRELMEQHSAKPFPDPYLEGFGWDEDKQLVFPGLGEVRCHTRCHAFMWQRFYVAAATADSLSSRVAGTYFEVGFGCQLHTVQMHCLQWLAAYTLARWQASCKARLHCQ